MKKILLFLSLLIGTLANGQNFVARSGPTVTAQDARLAAKLNIYMPHIRGFNLGNGFGLNGGLDTLGGVVYDDSSAHIWYRDTVIGVGHKWSEILKAGDAGTGTVTSIIGGYGLLGGTITATGIFIVDTAGLSNYWVRRHDSTIVFVTPTQMNAQGFLKNINGITAGGDLTGTYPNPTISSNVVTLAKLQQLPPFSFIANPTASVSNAQSSYFGYGTIWNNDTVKIDTTTLKHVFGATGVAGITQLTGDGTTPIGSGSQPFTLATVNGNVYASNTFLKFSVNGKGLVTGSTPVIGSDITTALGFTPIPLTALSATTPIVYNNATGVISCPTCGSSGGGISSLNGLTTSNQLFAVGYGGTSFNIVSASVTHTFNIPLLNSADTGLPTPAMYNTWNAKASVPSAGLVYSTGSALADVTVLAPLTYSTGILGADTVAGNENFATQSFVLNHINPPQTLTYTQLALNNTLSISGGNTQTFLVATHSLAGLIDSGHYSTLDSLRLRTYSFPIINIGAVMGLKVYGTTGDSVGIGGTGFYQPDTLNTNGYPFLVTGVPDTVALGAGDSLWILNGNKQVKIISPNLFQGALTITTTGTSGPSTLIGNTLNIPQYSGGGGAVSSVSDNGGGTLTISPTTGAVLAGINLANANTWSVGQTFSAGITLGGSITLTGSSGSLNIGDISHVLLHTYTRNVNSDGGLDLNAATGAAVNVSINGVIKDATLSTGEKQWNGYTTSGSFTGTPISLVGPDASGIMVQPTGAQLAGFVTPGSVAQTVVTNPLTGVLNTLPRLNNFSVNYATTTNLNSNTYINGTAGLGATLTAANPGALGTIDGIASAVGDTILVKNEGTQSHNGAYIVTVVGNGSTAYVLTRETYSSFAYNETAGASFYVEKGTANGVTTWYQTTTGAVAMGTTNLVYATENLGTGVSGTIGATQFGFGLSSGVLTSNGLNFYTAADSSANFKKVNVVGTPADSCGICVTISRIGVPAVGSGQGGSGGITLFPANSNVNPTIWLRDSRTGGLGVDTGLAIYNLNTTYAGGLSVVKSDEPGGLVIMSQNANLFFETHGVNGADFAAIAQGVSKHWSFGDNFGSDRGREMYIEGTVQLEDSLLVGGTSGYAFLSTATPLFNAYTTGRGWKIQVQNFTNQVGYNAIAIDSNANIYVPGGPYAVSGGLLYTGPSSGSSEVLQTASSTSSQVLIGGTTPAFGAVNLSSMVTNTLPVANGGTGDNTLTAYALLAGGTTSTGALQQVSGLGTSGQVLTSNGAGLLPTWQAATGGGGSGSPGGANQDLEVKSGSNFYGGGGTAIQDTVYKGVRLNSGARAAFLTASTDSTGLWLQNTIAAATGAQQFSQVLTLEGQGWKTTATAASQSVKFHEVVEPVQGAANPTGLLVWGSNINNSATYMTDTLSYSSAGVMNIESAAPTYQAAITGSGTGSFTFNLSSTGAVLGGLTLTGSSGETRLSAGSGYLTMFTGSSEHARLIGPDLLIGTTTDNAAAILNVVSTTKGTIPEPSMTTTQQNAISSPPEGLRVYDNVLHTPAFYNGSAWVDYGATPTLQQVLTAGSTFTGANTLTQANNALTIAGGQVVLGNVSNTRTWNPNTALGGSIFSIQTGTLNDATTSASGTVGNVYVSGITSSTLSATNTGVVYTNAYTFWINASPVGGTNVTITNPYALGVTGNSLFQGNITANSINLTGSNDLTAQTTATTVTSYAVPGSTTLNTFRVGGYVTVTAVSLDVIQLQVTWTDETSTSRSQSFFVQGATTGIGATGAYAYSPIDIRVLKGTTITVATILTTGTGSITYDVGANITQLY